MAVIEEPVKERRKNQEKKNKIERGPAFHGLIKSLANSEIM